jgi:hypothetical protein
MQVAARALRGGIAHSAAGSTQPAYQPYGRGTGPGPAAHWEAQPPVVAQGVAAALRTRPIPQPTASSLVVASCFSYRRVVVPERLTQAVVCLGHRCFGVIRAVVDCGTAPCIHLVINLTHTDSMIRHISFIYPVATWFAGRCCLVERHIRLHLCQSDRSLPRWVLFPTLRVYSLCGNPTILKLHVPTEFIFCAQDLLQSRH